MAQERRSWRQGPNARFVVVTVLNVCLAVWFLFLGMMSFLFHLTIDVCEVGCARIGTIASWSSAGVWVGLLGVLVYTAIKARKQDSLKRSILMFAEAAAVGLLTFAAGAITFGLLVDV